jgi:Ca-activated chloride channel family protein
VQVGTFGRQITIGPPIVGNPRELMRAVERALDPKDADTFGPSPLWDAIDAAIAALAQATGRRAVIVVTDGRATGNREGREAVSGRAIAAGVTVSALGEAWEMVLRQDATTGVRVRPGVALEWIAMTTGGLYVADEATTPAPGPALERLLADLHGRYTLGFTPPMRDGKTHGLEIRVKRPGLTLRARRTFVAPGE